MAPAPPTGREFLIVAILLAVLVFPLVYESSLVPSFSQVIKSAETTNTTHTSSLLPLNTDEHGHGPLGAAMNWGSAAPPETTVVAHVPGELTPFLLLFPQNYQRTNTGWTLFEKLYIYRGIVYIVSDHPSSLPDVQFILSKGIPILLGAEEEEGRLPTENEIKVITSQESKKLFGGTSAQVIDGFSVRIIYLPVAMHSY